MHLITYKANELSTYYSYLTESVFGSNELTNTYNTYKTQIENETDESNLDTLVEAGKLAMAKSAYSAALSMYYQDNLEYVLGENLSAYDISYNDAVSEIDSATTTDEVAEAYNDGIDNLDEYILI